MDMKKPAYTEEQIIIISQNPYTHCVTPHRVTFTLEFKEFFVEQVEKPGMTTAKILRAAGYDSKMFSQSTRERLRQRILSEAASEEGLQPPRGMTTAERINAYAKKDLDKQRTSTSIKELQNKVVHLEQQVEFLKKISNIYLPPPKE